jgi:hypothetical protein
MNCPSPEQWHLLSMNLIGQPEEDALLAHAQSCDACRAALKEARRDHARLLQSFELLQRRHDRLREELMATVPQELPHRPQFPRLVRVWHGLGDTIMTLNTGNRRIAAVLLPAACILLAVGICLILGKGTVAFATVLERMRQAHTMVCDTTTTIRMEFSEAVVEMVEQIPQEQAPTAVPTERTTRGKLSMYSDGTTEAWRLDQLDPPSTQWTFPDRMVSIDEDGRRTVIKFAEHPNPDARCESPEWWLDRLLKLTETPDRELGQEMLEDRKVVGFEISGWKLGYGARPTPGADATTTPTAVVHLWVDASTGLPVRMHVEHAMALRMPGIVSTEVSQTWEHIEWDVPLDPQSFEPPPPMAAAPVKELDMSGTEEGLIDGLRAYAAASERVTRGRFVDLPADMLKKELPEGEEREMARETMGYLREFLHGYPKDLDASLNASAVLRLSIIAPSVSRSMVLAARASGDAQAVAVAEDEAKRFLEELTTDVAYKLGQATLFYTHLLREGREPEYFGATVKPGDWDAVLMRWKLDDRHWRVIYGDLRAETVPMDQQPNGDVSPDSQFVQPPASTGSQPAEAREEGVEIPAPSEEALLDGLRAYAAEIERIKALFGERFAELSELMEQELPDDPEAAQVRALFSGVLEVLGHGYPQQLDTSCLFQLSIISPSLERARELVARARGDADALARWADEREAAAGNAEAAARLAERRETARKEYDELGRNVSAMLLFYRQLLVEDREPEYFGAMVKPGDSGAVLVRWKLDNEHVRVIYGDLRAETVRIED